MQQLIVKCLTLFVPAEQADLRDEVIAEFTRGSREYCMLALSIVSVDEDGDGVADNVTFGTFFKWLKSDDNFLLFPIQKTRVMLWLFDLFQKFDGDHSGSVSEQVCACVSLCASLFNIYSHDDSLITSLLLSLLPLQCWSANHQKYTLICRHVITVLLIYIGWLSTVS